MFDNAAKWCGLITAGNWGNMAIKGIDRHTEIWQRRLKERKPGLFAVKLRSRCNPSGTKAKQLCLEDASGASCCEISSEKFKHHAEHRAHNETFAPMPSLLQGHTSIDRVSSCFLVV